jgi:putative membrane protein
LRIVRGERCRRFCPERADSSAAARTILDERYAKGEIDDEEYRRKKEMLRQ